MTSISSNYAAVSPRDRLQNQLLSEVSAGTIPSGDQSSLTAALDSIDKSLSGGQASQSGPPAPGDVKAKIDSLIQGQVDSGALTGDQAKELKQLFSDTFSAHGAHGRRHHHASPDDSQAAAASSSSSDAGSSTDPGKLLDQFLQTLKDSAQKTASYSPDGTTNQSALSLLVNFTT